MKEKLKTMIYPLCATVIALLFIILLTLPYFVEDGFNANGYYLLSIYVLGGFSPFMLSFFQFFHVIVLLLLLNLGFLGILEKTGVVEFKKAYKNWTYNKLVKVLITVMAGLSLIVLLSVIILCSKYHIRIGVGAILNTILSIMACVAFWLLEIYGIFDGTYKSKQEKVITKNTDTESQQEISEEDSASDTIQTAIIADDE